MTRDVDYFFFFSNRPREFLFILFFSFYSVKCMMYVHIYWHGKMFTTYCWMTKRFIYSFYLPIILFDNDDDFKMDIWIFWVVLGLDLYLLCFFFLSFWACVFCLLFVFPIFSLSPLVSFTISIPCLAGFCALPPPSPLDSEWGSSSWTRCVRELRLGWGPAGV